MEDLCKKKKAEWKISRRRKDDAALKEAAKQASSVFERAASSEKESNYLHKLWQLHTAMNGAAKQSEIPDFKREDGVWVRTLKEKGTALIGEI